MKDLFGAIPIPDFVWIYGIRVAVIREPLDKPYEGMWSSSQQTLHISSRRAGSHLRELFLHELLHAVDSMTLDPATRPDFRDSKFREGDIRRMSTGLYAVFSDPRNRGFVDWFTSTTEEPE